MLMPKFIDFILFYNINRANERLSYEPILLNKTDKHHKKGDAHYLVMLDILCDVGQDDHHNYPPSYRAQGECLGALRPVLAFQLGSSHTATGVGETHYYACFLYNHWLLPLVVFLGSGPSLWFLVLGAWGAGTAPVAKREGVGSRFPQSGAMRRCDVLSFVCLAVPSFVCVSPSQGAVQG